MRLVKQIQNEKGFGILVVTLFLLATAAISTIYLMTGKFLKEEENQTLTIKKLKAIALAISNPLEGTRAPSNRSYYQDVGAYPTVLGDLLVNPGVPACSQSTSTFQMTGWCGPYWTEPISNLQGGYEWKDAWGSTIQWDNALLALTSYGPNRATGGSDDIIKIIEPGIIKEGLLIHLDPARGDGNNFPSTVAYTPWVDLTKVVGNFINAGSFTSCGGVTCGWLGTGANTSPYRVKFDGTNSGLAGSNTSLPVGNSPKTFLAWIRSSLTDGSSYMLFNYGPETTDNSFWIGTFPSGFCGATARLLIYTWTWPLFLCSVSQFNDNVWHFVGVVYDGTAYKMYFDATLEATSTTVTTSTTLHSNGYASIAYYSGMTGATPFIGEIGYLFFYNRALSTAEIQKNYNATKPRFSGATCN